MCLSGYAASYAVPACPFPEKIQQPDGSSITVCLHGDEFTHYTTTADGYTIVKNSAGYYVYAQQQAGQLVPSAVVARDESARTATDKVFLQSIQKNIVPVETATGASLRATTKSMTAHPLLHNYGKYDMSNFRGLIILVEFTDCSFSRSDMKQLMDSMVNKKGFDGFMSTSLIPEKIRYTGSVRDYYYENSMGQFDPKFDIVGPVKVNYSQYYANSSTNGRTLAVAAAKAVNDSVDFSIYDRDGDKKVDMIFFVYAGYGANFSGNDSRLIWPHASTITGTSLDGVQLGRYACSTEMYGKTGSNTIDGIGTICHEFSHVLGLPDEYDTDYASSGGTSIHPAKWTIMASGSYLNQSRTPAGYTLYERYALGFAKPQVINAAGEYTLPPLNTSNQGYRIDTQIKNEFFLIDNRQKSRWDAYLPGHGMTVFRVDSTNVDIWEDNDINVNPSHNYLQLVRANPKYNSSGTTTTVTDSDGDPFPGSGEVTSITNATTPNLKSWTGSSSPFLIKDIKEGADSIITFTIEAEDIPSMAEDFEAMDSTSGDGATVERVGRFCTWTLSGGAEVAKTGEGYGNGAQALSFIRKSEVKTSEIDKTVTAVSFSIFNPTSSMAIFCCYSSTDGGNVWKSMSTVDGVANITVTAGGTATVFYNTEIEKPMFRILEYTGNRTAPCYVDDFSLTYQPGSGGVDDVFAADGSALKAYCDNGTLYVSTESGESVSVYNAGGSLVASVKPVDGSASVALPAHGFYIVSQQGKSIKVIY